MSVKVYYQHHSGTPAKEITMNIPMVKEFTGPAVPWIADPVLREMTVTLQPGQRWPNRLRKGVPIEYEIMGRRFIGTVKRRRMGVLVCWGEFERDAAERIGRA